MDTGKVVEQPWPAAELRRVDLRGVRPGGPGWVEACAAVAASMEELGCVVVAHGALDDGELRRDLFGRAMPDLFALPLSVKQGTLAAGNRIGGYIGPHPVKAPGLESLRISEATDAGKVHAFTDLLWPHGNTAFCNTIEAFAKVMLELDHAVQKMVLESLSVRKEHVDSHLASLVYHIRLSHYGAPPPTAGLGGGGDEAMYAAAHTDSTMVTIIAQHEVEGLQVQARDGTWINVAPEPGTFALVAGEMLTVLTNGRVPACVHRVRTPSKRERLSAMLGSAVRHGAVVSAQEDLVDHDRHPLRFRPCDFDEYVKFRFGQERPTVNNALQEFCGIVPAPQPTK